MEGQPGAASGSHSGRQRADRAGPQVLASDRHAAGGHTLPRVLGGGCFPSNGPLAKDIPGTWRGGLPVHLGECGHVCVTGGGTRKAPSPDTRPSNDWVSLPFPALGREFPSQVRKARSAAVSCLPELPSAPSRLR